MGSLVLKTVPPACGDERETWQGGALFTPLQRFLSVYTPPPFRASSNVGRGGQRSEQRLRRALI